MTDPKHEPVDPWVIIEKLRLQHRDEIHNVWMKLNDENRSAIEALTAQLDALKSELVIAKGDLAGARKAIDGLDRERDALKEENERLKARWMPIKTAPKDGTVFLAVVQGDHFNCWWHDNGYGEQYWMDQADSEPAPTHWMPLPNPPAALTQSPLPESGESVEGGE